MPWPRAAARFADWGDKSLGFLTVVSAPRTVKRRPQWCAFDAGSGSTGSFDHWYCSSVIWHL